MLTTLVCVALAGYIIFPVCHNHILRGEYQIAEPTKCVKHSNITKINCSANIYYPQGEFAKIPIVTCELYETISETVHYSLAQNYTLTHANSEIITLSPTLAPMAAYFDTINFQVLTHLFPATDMGFEDLNSSLGINSKSKMIRNQLSSF